MAASVLGKRSRRVIDAEDIATELPKLKRRTRRTTPTIYEDESDNLTVLAAGTSLQLRKNTTRRPKCKRSQDGNWERDTTVGAADSDLQLEEVATQQAVDTENIPPLNFNTPSTNRFKDVFKAVGPSTPKRRVRVFGTPCTPKSRCKTSSVSKKQSAFSEARQLFTQSSNATRLVGRDSERTSIRQFISQAIQRQRGGCTYISGPPGTGKSALVHEVLDEFECSDSLRVSKLNCVSLKTATDVYRKLLQDLSSNTPASTINLKQHLSATFLKGSRNQMNLILLDEIDNLVDTDCEVLYTIFEWALHKSSSVILIGIANALDLTDRFLPNLKARGLRPQLLQFLPYTASQISTIISDKLRSLLPENTTVSRDFVPFMQSAAVQLCGKKIASQTGDIRKAFSLVQRIIEHVERETADKTSTPLPFNRPLSEISNATNQPLTPVSSPEKSGSGSLLAFTPESAPRATIAHAAKMASSVFNNGTMSRLSGLNLQQKAVLCSLVGRERRKVERNPFITPSKSTNKIPSVKELFFNYSTLCKRDEGLLQPLKDTEFRDVVASLETLGLVHEHRGRNSSLLTPTSTPSRAGRNHDDRQIVSAVSEKEMRESLNGAGADLLRRLLDDE